MLRCRRQVEVKRQDDKNDPDAVPKVVNKLSRGRYFGEVALRERSPRTATVTASSSEVVCMSIDRTTFTALLGPLQTILNRRSLYQQIAKPEVPPRRAAIYAGMLMRGRQQEGEMLAGQIEKLLSTAQPSVTMLTGNPGIGKSHTLRELRNFYMNHLPLMYIEASTHEREPLSIWVPLLRMLLAGHFETEQEQLRKGAILTMMPPDRPAADVESIASLILGKSTKPLPERHLRGEVEVVSALLCRLLTQVHALLLDGLEKWSETAWHVLCAVLERQPPVAFILATRELENWSDVRQGSTFEAILNTCGGQTARPTYRYLPAMQYTHVELLPLEETVTPRDSHRGAVALAILAPSGASHPCDGRRRATCCSTRSRAHGCQTRSSRASTRAVAATPPSCSHRSRSCHRWSSPTHDSRGRCRRWP